MKNINKSIEYAMNGNPIGFKDAIVDSINSKIADAVQIRKMKISVSKINPVMIINSWQEVAAF